MKRERRVMRTFHQQFCECKKIGMVREGSLKKFKDYPELLPPFWHPSSPKFLKVLEENPKAGLTPMMCLRFNGECNSGNKKCRKMRGM